MDVLLKFLKVMGALSAASMLAVLIGLALISNFTPKEVMELTFVSRTSTREIVGVVLIVFGLAGLLIRQFQLRDTSERQRRSVKTWSELQRILDRHRALEPEHNHFFPSRTVASLTELRTELSSFRDKAHDIHDVDFSTLLIEQILKETLTEIELLEKEIGNPFNEVEDFNEGNGEGEMEFQLIMRDAAMRFQLFLLGVELGKAAPKFQTGLLNPQLIRNTW